MWCQKCCVLHFEQYYPLGSYLGQCCIEVLISKTRNHTPIWKQNPWTLKHRIILPQASHVYCNEIKPSYLINWLWLIEWDMYVRCFTTCVIHIKCSVNYIFLSNDSFNLAASVLVFPPAMPACTFSIFTCTA